MSALETEEVLTTEQACELLKVSRKTVYKLARQQHIRCRKVGREWRFPKSDLLAYLRGER